jgi:hypothetical protein
VWHGQGIFFGIPNIDSHSLSGRIQIIFYLKPTISFSQTCVDWDRWYKSLRVNFVCFQAKHVRILTWFARYKGSEELCSQLYEPCDRALMHASRVKTCKRRTCPVVLFSTRRPASDYERWMQFPSAVIPLTTCSSVQDVAHGEVDQ